MPNDYQFQPRQEHSAEIAAAFEVQSRPKEERLTRVIVLECVVVPFHASAHPDLPADTEVRLERVPDNSYDRWAIRVKSADGRYLGYLPSGLNQSVARLMDAGKQIRAYIADSVRSEPEPQLSLRLYMETPLRKEEEDV